LKTIRHLCGIVANPKYRKFIHFRSSLNIIIWKGTNPILPIFYSPGYNSLRCNHLCWLSKILLQRTGVVFPRRPIDAPPIFTPPAHDSQTYDSPRYAAGSLNERMSSDVETLRFCSFPNVTLLQLPYLLINRIICFFWTFSLGDLNKIRNVTELLSDMVHALNPSDRTVREISYLLSIYYDCLL
jgi:hypothetical protein